MLMHRRKLLELAGAIAAAAWSRAARADTYPSRPVRILVGYAAGAASISRRG
jgi:tripartite-type tricarboxylate transporter receptor subunit TctC